LPTICEAANIDVPDSLDIDGRSFLPQLNGELGHPREWIYSWYSKDGDVSKARVFARNHRYKLYDSGEFYDVPNDYPEQHPLDLEDLDQEAKEAHKSFGSILEHYGKRRLEEVPGSE